MIANPRLLAAAVAGCSLAGIVAPAAGSASHRAVGNIQVFAHVPAPGEPSLSLVTPSHDVYVGTFESVTGTDTHPSKVFRYSRHGRLRRTYVIRGQTAGAAHGVQVAQRDRRGRLYLLDQNPARVIVLDPATGRQHTWAGFADVAPCGQQPTTQQPTGQCSRTVADNPPEPDYAAWLPDGSLLVTDYAQQLIWRVPPHRHGQRPARVWLNDMRLDGEQFGPAGIVMRRGHHSLFLTVATGGISSTDPANDASKGRLYRIDLRGSHRFARLDRLWSSGPGEAPDGFAVSRHARHVYIAMAGPSGNSVVDVVHPGRGGWRRAGQVPASPGGVSDSPVMWDTPTSAQFLGTRLLVTNQAYFTGDSSHWVLFDVATRHHGLPDYVPAAAG